MLSRGVSSSQLCICQTSTKSVPNRLSERSRSAIKECREASTFRIPSEKLIPALVAITTSSLGNKVPINPPITRSLSPSPYVAAVSKKFPPASKYARHWSAASISSVSRPHVIVPRPRRESAKPLFPARLFSMA